MLAGASLFHDENDQDDAAGAIGGIFSGLVGYAIGASLGTYWAGNTGDMAGSYGATLGGSVIGFAIGGLGFLAAERWFADSNDGRNDRLNAAILFSGPPIAATVGFALTRAHDSTAPPARVSFEQGGWTHAAMARVTVDEPTPPSRSVRVRVARYRF
ncbi:MAG: hypothetical protein ABIH26_10780 [Candidatus Eisenbacteria bacterium]